MEEYETGHERDIYHGVLNEVRIVRGVRVVRVVRVVCIHHRPSTIDH